MMLVSLILALTVSLGHFEPPATAPVVPIDPAAFDRLVIDSLRDIHNIGASLYNEAKDYNGCYRMYEGAIRTIRPLLAHRPAVQKRIDDTLAKLGDDETVRNKAFRLHELIETVRGELRDGAAQPAKETKKEAKPETKKETKEPAKPKTTEPEKGPTTKPKENGPEKSPAKPPMTVPEKEPVKSPSPVPLTGVPTPSNPAPTWSSVVSLAGKPLPRVEVTLVTLDLASPKIVSGMTDEKGKVEVRLPAFGRYAISISGPGVPTKYQTTTTSGLKVDFKTSADAKPLNLTE
ncbi:MAG: hypothetical protein U0798_11725 [Gemmataceae bacterium]